MLQASQIYWPVADNKDMGGVVSRIDGSPYVDSDAWATQYEMVSIMCNNSQIILHEERWIVAQRDAAEDRRFFQI